MSWHPFKHRADSSVPSGDAQRANQNADRQLEQARRVRQEAHEVSLQLQASRNSNHFAASFEEAMTRGTHR